jgi:hypothetical protein
MQKLFIRALIVTAVLQFVITRARAGRVENEGEAEMLWARYPFVVVANALTWTLLLAVGGKIIGALRSLRAD